LQVSAVDTVGAGDSFLATLLDSLLDGKAQEVALERACRIGAFVATKQGATPRHDAEGIKALKTEVNEPPSSPSSKITLV
jgi:fructokinase